jgi:hypothetical protein
MPNAISSYATLPNYGSTACALINNYLYVTGEFNTHMVRVNLDTGDVSNSWLSEAQGFHKQYYYPYAIAADSQYVYSIRPYAYEGIHISRTPYDNPTGGDPNWVKNDTSTGIGSYFSSACHYNGNIYIGSAIGKIYRVDTTSKANTLFYTHSSGGGITSMVDYAGFLYYVIGSSRGLYKVSITNPAAGSAQSVTNSGFWGSSQILNGLTVYNSDLFVSFQFDNAIGQLDLTTPTRFNTNFSDNSTTYIDGPTGIVVYSGNLYIVSYSLGKSKKILAKVAVPTLYFIPSAPKNIWIDTGNTRTVASGNLKVSIFDPLNTLANNVYYEYSLNGSVYINTNVNAGPSPNNLYVLSSDISNTILVRAKNSLGNSTPISLQTVIYQKPTVAPSSVTLSLISSGNVQVTVSESNSVPYYYLNNVSYVCYPYPNSGTNLSNNISAYTSNVGILANTNTTYIPVASYVSGLSANTYTFYVKAQNQFGNTETTTISENISVYTLPNPPVIDPSNTLSKTSGNLTVTFNDTTNTPLNNINYVYFVYDSTVDLYY